MPTMKASLGPVVAATSPRLISPAAWDRIREVAGTLPFGTAYTTFGFECALDRAEPAADFLVSFGAAARGRALLASLPADGGPICELARHWSDPSSRLHGEIDNVWLEWDLAGPATSASRPSLFFAPISADRAQAAGAARCGLTLLRGEPPSGTIARTLDVAWRALPPQARIFQVGVMLSRAAGSVRLCASEMSADMLPRYLDWIGYPGDVEPILDVVRDIYRLVDSIALDVDIGDDGIGPRVGLECYARQPRALLDELERRGCCRRSKLLAVLASTGTSDMRDGRVDDWPEPMRRGAELMRGSRASAIERTLHHTKLVYRPGVPLRAKAYLAARHSWVAAGGSAPASSSASVAHALVTGP